NNASSTVYINVTKATLTVTADNQIKTYGNSDPSFTFAYSGFAGSDTASVIDTPPTCSVVGVHTNFGSYSISCSGGIDNNYDFNYVSGTLTVNKRPITVTADPKSKNYEDVDPTLTYSITSGSLVGEDSFNGSLTRDAGEAIGTYAITQGTLALSSNYTLSFIPGILTIVDNIGPSTTDNVDSTWHNKEVSITLTCTDNAGGSGCANTYHTTDGTDPDISSSTTNPFTLSAEGNYTIKYFSKDNAGNLEDVKTATNHVMIDKTNPTITFNNKTAANAGGWNNTDVTVNWNCSDVLSGVVSATDSHTVSTEGSGQSSVGTCTDLAGNINTNTQTGINIDKTSPGVPGTPSTTSPTNSTTQTWSWTTATDTLSGIQNYLYQIAGDTTVALTSTGSNVSSFVTHLVQGIYSFFVKAVDKAENVGGESPAGSVTVDTTAPTISAAVSAGTVGSNGWYTSDVTVHFTCSDTGGSGVASCPADQVLSTEGSSVSSTAQTTTDNAGNTSNSSNIVTVKIDKTNPIDPIVTSSSHTVSTWSNNNTIDISWSGATDGLSGVAGYSYLFDTSPTTLPDTISEGADTSTTSTALSNDSSHYFHLRTQDNAGNWTSTVHIGPFFIDATAPTVSADNTSVSWRTSNVTITLSATDVGGSGLNNVRYNWDSAATESVGTIFTNGTTVNIPSEGDHTLYLYANDHAGSSNTFSGTYKLDTSDPTVSATGDSTSWQNTVPTITVSANDTVSNVASVKYAWDATAATGSATSNGADLT
ncbi:hypothetical protein D4S03_07725, partial [bacterium]